MDLKGKFHSITYYYLRNSDSSNYSFEIWKMGWIYVNILHSWAKFKIVLVRKSGRKFYYFMTKFQGSGFSFQSLNQNIKVVVFPSNFWIQFFKVVVFPSNFWNTTIIWRFFRVILNFAQECYYLENKVGVVDFTKARGLVKFQSPRALAGPWALKHYQSLGVCKIYYSHFIFEVMYHSLASFTYLCLLITKQTFDN